MAYTATGLVLDLKTGLPVTSRPLVRLYELTGTGSFRTPVTTSRADAFGRISFAALTDGKLYTAYAPMAEGFVPVPLTVGGLSATLMSPGSNSTALTTDSGGAVGWTTITDAMLAGSISATKLTAGAVSTILNTSAAGTQNWGKLTSAMLSGDYTFPGAVNATTNFVASGSIVAVRAGSSRLELDGGDTGNRDGGYLTFNGHYDGTNWVNVGTTRASQIFFNDGSATTNVAISLRYGTGVTTNSFSTYVDGLTLLYNGFIGIGSTAPTSKLVVKGYNSGSFGHVLQLVGEAASGADSNQLNVTDAENTWGLIIGKNNSGVGFSGYHGPDGAHIINFDNARLNFGVNNTRKMYMDNSLVYLDVELYVGGTTTTASGANAFLDSGNNNRLMRSTSSRRYKRDFRPLRQSTLDAVLQLVPFIYKSDATADDYTKDFIGLGAEDLHDLGLTEFVNYDRDNRPDGIAYDRLTVPLIAIVQDLHRRLTALESRASRL